MNERIIIDDGAFEIEDEANERDFMEAFMVRISDAIAAADPKDRPDIAEAAKTVLADES